VEVLFLLLRLSAGTAVVLAVAVRRRQRVEAREQCAMSTDLLMKEQKMDKRASGLTFEPPTKAGCAHATSTGSGATTLPVVRPVAPVTSSQRQVGT